MNLLVNHLIHIQIMELLSQMLHLKKNESVTAENKLRHERATKII